MSAAEEFDPKKRLVGAGILIGLAVVILPIILDGDNGTVSGINSDQTQIIEALKNDYVSSDEEVTVFVSKITPIEAPSGNGDTDNNTDNNVSSSTVSESKPANEKSGRTPGSGEPIERGWVVRVATLVNVESANKLLADLNEKGFAPDSESIDTSKGEGTRIWIGPYERRVDAARARARLEQQIGLPGLITAFP